MVELDVIIEKVNRIQNCLQRIHDTVGKDLASLEELDVQDIVVLNLQRAVQQVIDIASYLISIERLGVPQTLKEGFQILERNKVISSDIARKMEKMVGFRNIAVHNYEVLDPQILRSIIEKHLSDIEEFYSAILVHYKP